MVFQFQHSMWCNQNHVMASGGELPGEGRKVVSHRVIAQGDPNEEAASAHGHDVPPDCAKPGIILAKLSDPARRDFLDAI
jgi:hypothetical protein